MGYRIVALLAVLWFAPFSRAAGWTSADGKLSFDLPTDGSLTEAKSPPAPATAMWATADGKARLLVIIQPAPGNITRLERAGLEEGFVEQLPGGTLISSTEAAVGGVTVFTMAATNRRKAYVEQSIFLLDGTVYTVFAAGPKQVSTDPRLAGVFQSVRISSPTSAAPGEPAAADPPTATDVPTGGAESRSTHNVSVAAGEIGFGVLCVGGIVYAVRRSLGARPTPPPLPRKR